MRPAKVAAGSTMSSRGLGKGRVGAVSRLTLTTSSRCSISVVGASARARLVARPVVSAATAVRRVGETSPRERRSIRLPGRGRPSPDGGETGDIVLQVSVRPHPVFTRDGLNLRVTVPVSFTEAALGATIEVPTLGGDPVKLRVAPGTPSGRVLRVKGRGVATSKGTGDLLAEVQVVVPTGLDDDAREALEKFQSLEPKENPRADLMQKARG